MSLTPDELGRKIREAQAKQGLDPDRPARESGSQTGAGRALRAGIDLAAALLVGGFLGYWLDRAFGTLPLFTILMFFVGFAAGFLNIYRAETGQDFGIGLRGKSVKRSETADKNKSATADGEKKE